MKKDTRFVTHTNKCQIDCGGLFWCCDFGFTICDCTNSSDFSPREAEILGGFVHSVFACAAETVRECFVRGQSIWVQLNCSHFSGVLNSSRLCKIVLVIWICIWCFVCVGWCVVLISSYLIGVWGVGINKSVFGGFLFQAD